MDNKENTIKWIHISDIHVGHENYSEQAMREELPKYLKKIAPQNGFDLLLLTGDFIFAPSFLEQVAQFDKQTTSKIKSIVHGIQRAIGVRENNTCLAIGNHDVVRTTGKSEIVTEVEKNYRTKAGDIATVGLNTMLQAESRFGVLYRDLLKRKYPLIGHFIEEIPLENTRSKNNHKLEVLHLDTVITAEAVTDKGTMIIQDGNLIVGIKSLHKVLNEMHKPGNPIIAIGHHPLSSLEAEEREAVIREMEKAGISVYFCGHTHTASITKVGDKIIQVCCGTNMERKANGDPADMIFYTGEYDLMKKTIHVIPHQYFADKKEDIRWEVANKATFQQTQFEIDTEQKEYYYPLEKAPYYTFIKKYGKQIRTVLDGTKSYVPVKAIENLKRPQASSHFCDRKILEADTGYGKTTYLREKVCEIISDARNQYQEINDIILNCKMKFPFYVNLQSKRLSNRWDAISSLLVKDICGRSHSGPEFKTAVDWITKLATQGRMELFVDGFECLSENDRDDFTASLQQFLKDYPNVGVLLASKPYVFDSENMRKRYEDFSFFQLNAFNESQITKYCHFWFKNDMEDTVEDNSITEKAEEIAKQILSDPPLKELAGIPLLLNTLLQVNKSMNALPKSRIRLYDNFVFALLKNRATPETDVRILATIALEMRKQHASSLSKKHIKKSILTICQSNDWLCDLESLNDKETESLLGINDNSSLLKKLPGVDGYAFYNDEIRDYFASLALTKGYYVGVLKWMERYREAKDHALEYSLVNEIKMLWDDAENGNMILLAILQMNVPETFVVIEELLNHIACEDTLHDSSVETNSHLRNLILRAILDGAYVCKDQRKRAFETVQKGNLFSLQADILEEVFNSQFSLEFEKTCTQYMTALFRLLRKNSNPIQYLYDVIMSENRKICCKELEKNLYVLDGVLWSKGRKYLDIYQQTTSINSLVMMLKQILQDESIDALCKRRACGVLHRLITIGGLDQIDEQILQLIFDVYENTPSEMEEKSIYAGIRIFNAIPLNAKSIAYIKNMNVTDKRKAKYQQLYSRTKNHQDKLSAFEATILCRCWDYETIQAVMKRDDLFKSGIIDLDNLETRIEILREHHFFE